MVVKRIVFGMGLCLLALAVLGAGCGRGESSGKGGDGNGRPTTPSPQAARARAFLEELLSWAPTNGLNNLSANHPIETGRLERVRRRLFGLEDVMLSVPDKAERIVLLRDSANRILDGVIARTNEWEEFDYHLSSCIMLDASASAIWRTSGDGDLVLSLWAHQRRAYAEACERCQAECLALKKENQRLSLESYRQALKSATLRRSDLTEADLAIRKECERLPYVHKRWNLADQLSGWYSHWDVGEPGRRLDGGRLYERFKSLTPEQLKEIEDRVRATDKE